MMSISTTLRSGVFSHDVDGLPAVGRADDIHLVVFEQGGQREDIADIVVDDQHLAAAQDLVGAVQPFDHVLLFRGRSATTRCRNSAVSSSNRSGDWTSLRTMLLAIDLELRLFLGGQFLAGEHHDRQIAQRRLACIFSSSSKPVISGSRRSSTQQSNGDCSSSASSASRAGADGD